MIQTTPSGGYSIVADPPFSAARLRSISREPNPRRVGGRTGGPPRSIHRNLSRASMLRLTTSQVIATDPAAVERAPYLAAFVASSCSERASERDKAGLSQTDGPSAAKRFRPP